MNTANLFSVLVAGIAIGAYFYSIHVSRQNSLPSALEPISLFKGMQTTMQQGKQPVDCRVAIGYNSNLDLIIDAIPLFKKLKIQPGLEQEHLTVGSFEELQEVFHHHFAAGGAAERFVSNGHVFSELVKEATILGGIESTGGNAALMANKLAIMGCSVLLGGPVGPRLQRHLHPSITLAEKTLADNDEVHLIMEYQVGHRWGPTVAPRANRFIVTRDEANGKVLGAEAFHDAVKAFSPSLVVISGFHMMEGYDSAFRSQRLNQVLKHFFDTVSTSTRIHLELASMTDKQFVKELLDKTLSTTDSLGLNEQELLTVFQVLDGKSLQAGQLTGRVPDQNAVVQVLKTIFRVYGKAQNKHGRRGLTRIHFHSLAFHIVAHRKGMWDNSKSSVAAGSYIATAQACDVENSVEKLQAADIDLLLPWNTTSTVKVWIEDDLEFSLAPVVVCKVPLKTVGLGDAISATGLLYHTYQA
eukprot:GILK01003019.1.p1 GENE.GILK01003019.1~~GILK01003019.1.p1  ORF type:complete len:483 (+),score=90.59 GILK01003019.1:40-1449(+)